MKSLIVLPILALVAFVEADEESKPKGLLAHVEIDEKCIAETGLSNEEAEKIFSRQHSDEKKVKEYVLCNMKRMNVFTEESGYNADRLVTELTVGNFPEETARELVTKCVDNNEQKSAPAEWAYRFVDCVMTEADKAKRMRNRDSTTNATD